MGAKFHQKHLGCYPQQQTFSSTESFTTSFSYLKVFFLCAYTKLDILIRTKQMWI